MRRDFQLISVFFLIAFFGSHSQMAPAAGAGAGDDVTLPPGGSWKYKLLTTVLLNEPGAIDKDVGFQVNGEVMLESVWKGVPGERLLRVQFTNPQLLIKSRKAPAPEGFIQHSSKLEELSNNPFLIHWRNGKIQSVFIPLKEPLSIVNLKKGIASLFQFQLLDMQINETDSSGHCSVSYSSTGPLSFRKSKTACKSFDTPYLIHPDQLFSVEVDSLRIADYVMAENNAYIKSVRAQESHVLLVSLKPDAGNQVKIIQELTHIETATTNVVDSDNIKSVIAQITNEIGHFTEETLITEKENRLCGDVQCASFVKTVADNSKSLENYGNLKSANGFRRTINAVREANKDDIVKVLKKKQHKSILLAIYDILGTAQTLESHEAAMKQLRFTDEKHLDKLERYLWGLSMGSHPKHDIIKDLLNKYIRTSDLNEKLQETLVLTLASMANKYIKNPHNLEKNTIYNSVKDILYNGIDNCKNKPCQLWFIRGLKNLQCPETIPKLLEIALTSNDKSSVAAMKSLRSFPKETLTENVIKSSKTIFFQMKKKYDSSARTIAAEIILESDNLSETTLEEMFLYLLSTDKMFEVKKYVVQKIQMLGDKNEKFKLKLRNVLRRLKRVNNYQVMAQKGMSTAIRRSFLNNNAINGSMISVQETSSGLVKRGVFDIVLEESGRYCELFSLGLFSGGLNSFVSSEDEETNEDDAATAGLELTMLGTQIRPFVFFSGQGELMGHVWSGTASESTPAFQINTLVHDHLEYIRLGPGFIAELSLQTAVSFNLAGEIQISLWNRNSHSLVNQNAAMVMNGLLRVDSSFVQSKVEFFASMEPKLDLESDIEFSGNVAVCLRLKQPSILFKHNIFKEERIPGSKHSLRKAKYKKFEVPGRTYNLNQKNNEMCNIMMNR